MATSEGSFVGLDFGTTTTMLARTRGAGGVEVIPVGRATAWMPSVVGFSARGGDAVVGEDAETLPVGHARRSIKRAITFNEETVRLHLIDGPVEKPADELAVGVIREALRRGNWTSLKDQASGVRAGCPAMWDRGQRARYRAILAEAGLKVEPGEIIDEPIAAAVAWVNYRRQSFDDRVEGRLVVFDFGGGTLDIAVCDVSWRLDAPEITILSCLGIPFAGDKLDEDLVAYLNDQLTADDRYTGSSEQNSAVEREVRLAKEALSVEQEAVLRLSGYGLPDLRLSRAELEQVFRAQLATALDQVSAALRAALLRERNHLDPVGLRALTPEALDPSVNFVLLAGGMSRIPAVGDALQARFTQARVERVGDSFTGGIDGPQHLVVAGLIYDTDTYDRLNLHRPGFDVFVEWRSRTSTQWHERSIYRAHTPLYTPNDIYSNNADPCYRDEVTIPRDERVAEGRLVVRAETGERLDLRLDDMPIDGLPLQMNGGSVVGLKMYVDGRLVVWVDSHEARFGPHGGLRVEQWPVFRGPHAKRRSLDFRTGEYRPPKVFDYPHK